jgi:hypothetical protein
MKPDYNSKGQREAAMKWYDDLVFTEQRKVDKMVKNYQSFVKSRSNTPASKPGGVELVYSIRERIMK